MLLFDKMAQLLKGTLSKTLPLYSKLTKPHPKCMKYDLPYWPVPYLYRCWHLEIMVVVTIRGIGRKLKLKRKGNTR